jgi:hypothetical protein
VLPILAHAKRNLLAASARIVPAAASLHAELLQVKCSEDAATGFDLSKLDKYRWSPCYEKFRVEEQPDGTVLRCSDAVPLLNFDLQGMPAEELVAGGSAEVTITATQTARVNGVLLWFRLDMDGKGLVVGSEPCASGDSSTAKSGNVGGRGWAIAHDQHCILSHACQMRRDSGGSYRFSRCDLCSRLPGLPSTMRAV